MDQTERSSMTDEDYKYMCYVADRIMAVYERKYGPTGYQKLSNQESAAAERKRVQKIEDVILSDPKGSSEFLSFRAACSRQTLNRHRARLRREGKIK